jgi:hypothetical protein
MTERRAIVFPRDVLLIEIGRRCSFSDCAARMFIGLTKQEAFSYHGFDCERCGRWNNDQLNKTDAPEWWAEIEQR